MRTIIIFCILMFCMAGIVKSEETDNVRRQRMDALVDQLQKNEEEIIKNSSGGRLSNGQSIESVLQDLVKGNQNKNVTNNGTASRNAPRRREAEIQPFPSRRSHRVIISGSGH